MAISAQRRNSVSNQDLKVGLADMAANTTAGVVADQPQSDATADPTTVLVHPDELFPPIPDEELITDRRRRAAYAKQQDYLRLRQAYIATYNEALRLLAENSALTGEMDESRTYFARREEELITRHRRREHALSEAADDLQHVAYQTGWVELVCFALALITQRRPQYGGSPNFHATHKQVRREFALGDIKVVLVPGQQRFTLNTTAAGTETFTTDAAGNLDAAECRKLFGYLIDAGLTVDPSRIRLIMADHYQTDTYASDRITNLNPGLVRNKPPTTRSVMEAMLRDVGVPPEAVLWLDVTTMHSATPPFGHHHGEHLGG
jgi:hypothetical protein